MPAWGEDTFSCIDIHLDDLKYFINPSSILNGNYSKHCMYSYFLMQIILVVCTDHYWMIYWSSGFLIMFHKLTVHCSCNAHYIIKSNSLSSALMPAWGEDKFSCIDIYYRIIRGRFESLKLP
jgi:hypothetical protein